jgi:RHS repeat-associated protein
VLERYGYDGFGTPRYMTGNFGNRSSSSYGWETLFAAYRYDLESGLYQVRHRYLHPKLGRWGSRDPINELGFNVLTGNEEEPDRSEERHLYAYVANNPASHVDLFGLSLAECLRQAAAAGAATAALAQCLARSRGAGCGPAHTAAALATDAAYQACKDVCKRLADRLREDYRNTPFRPPPHWAPGSYGFGQRR